MDNIAFCIIWVFMGTLFLAMRCEKSKAGERAQFLTPYANDIQALLRDFIRIALSVGVWLTMGYAVCTGVLHVSHACLRALMLSGTTPQRLVGGCLVHSISVLMLSLMALIMTTYELTREKNPLRSLVLLVGNSLLQALEGPFVLADLLRGFTWAGDVNEG